MFSTGRGRSERLSALRPGRLGVTAPSRVPPQAPRRPRLTHGGSSAARSTCWVCYKRRWGGRTATGTWGCRGPGPCGAPDARRAAACPGPAATACSEMLSEIAIWCFISEVYRSSLIPARGLHIRHPPPARRFVALPFIMGFLANKRCVCRNVCGGR